MGRPILAPSGGGKTARRLSLIAFLKEKRVKVLLKEKPSFLPLTASYINFGNLNNGSGTIDDHQPLLLDSIASSVYEFIRSNTNLFMNLSISVQNLWSLLENYSIGKSSFQT